MRGGWSGRAEVDVEGEGDSQEGEGEWAVVAVGCVYDIVTNDEEEMLLVVEVVGVWRKREREYCARAGR